MTVILMKREQKFSCFMALEGTNPFVGKQVSTLDQFCFIRLF